MDHKQGWVFGGIERDSKKFFMVIVPDRTIATLNPIIHHYIKPGTTIMSDEWKAYDCLQNEGYNRGTVCHKRNFVSPDDPQVHTQNIEILWKYAKRNYPRNSTSDDMKEGYLQEYMYRKLHGKNIVNQMIHDIADMFNGNEYWDNLES